MISHRLNICLFPMEIVWADKKANLETMERVMDYVHPDTDLLILPETFSTGFPSGEDKESVRELAERNTGNTIKTLHDLAEKHSMAIAGSFIADTGGLLYNRAFMIEPSGDEHFEDKRHLFTMAGEQKIFTPGDKRLTVRFRGWNISMIICYDLRFPVWCRNVDEQYDLLIAIANWPETRVDAWNHLLPARAIENLSYVAGVDCRGKDLKGFSYDGSSAVYDFKGRDIAFRDQNSGLIYASLSKDKLTAFRTKFPAHLDADLFSFDN